MMRKSVYRRGLDEAWSPFEDRHGRNSFLKGSSHPRRHHHRPGLRLRRSKINVGPTKQMARARGDRGLSAASLEGRAISCWLFRADRPCHGCNCSGGDGGSSSKVIARDRTPERSCSPPHIPVSPHDHRGCACASNGVPAHERDFWLHAIHVAHSHLRTPKQATSNEQRSLSWPDQTRPDLSCRLPILSYHVPSCPAPSSTSGPFTAQMLLKYGRGLACLPLSVSLLPLFLLLFLLLLLLSLSLSFSPFFVLCRPIARLWQFLDFTFSCSLPHTLLCLLYSECGVVQHLVTHHSPTHSLFTSFWPQSPSLPFPFPFSLSLPHSPTSPHHPLPLD